MCCENDIHMLNGHLYDDLDGNIICISNYWKGLVDYFIASKIYLINELLYMYPIFF